MSKLASGSPGAQPYSLAAERPLQAVAIGLAAGLTATAVMTLGQLLEQRLTGREESRTPAKGVERATGVEPATDAGERQLSNATHWLYGTAVGAALVPLSGLREPVRSLSFLAGVWGVGVLLESFANPDQPVTEWTPGQIGTDFGHHVVYAATAGLAYRGLEAALAR